MFLLKVSVVRSNINLKSLGFNILLDTKQLNLKATSFYLLYNNYCATLACGHPLKLRIIPARVTALGSRWRTEDEPLFLTAFSHRVPYRRWSVFPICRPCPARVMLSLEKTRKERRRCCQMGQHSCFGLAYFLTQFWRWDGRSLAQMASTRCPTSTQSLWPEAARSLDWRH